MNEERAERHLPLKPAYFHILLTVVDTAIHGYGIRQEIDDRTDGRIVLAAGTLYETLQRLERDALVEEVDAPDDVADHASSRWRFYRATALGRTVLRLETERLEADLAVARRKLPASG